MADLNTTKNDELGNSESNTEDRKRKSEDDLLDNSKKIKVNSSLGLSLLQAYDEEDVSGDELGIEKEDISPKNSSTVSVNAESTAVEKLISQPADLVTSPNLSSFIVEEEEEIGPSVSPGEIEKCESGNSSPFSSVEYLREGFIQSNSPELALNVIKVLETKIVGREKQNSTVSESEKLKDESTDTNLNTKNSEVDRPAATSSEVENRSTGEADKSVLKRDKIVNVINVTVEQCVDTTLKSCSTLEDVTIPPNYNFTIFGKTDNSDEESTNDASKLVSKPAKKVKLDRSKFFKSADKSSNDTKQCNSESKVLPARNSSLSSNQDSPLSIRDSLVSIVKPQFDTSGALPENNISSSSVGENNIPAQTVSSPTLNESIENAKVSAKEPKIENPVVIPPVSCGSETSSVGSKVSELTGELVTAPNSSMETPAHSTLGVNLLISNVVVASESNAELGVNQEVGNGNILSVAESNVEFDVGDNISNVEPTVAFESNVSIKLNQNEGVNISIEEDVVKCTAAAESKDEFDENEKVSHVQVLTNPESNVNLLVDEAVTSSNTQSNIELDKNEEVPNVQVLTDPESNVNQLVDEAVTFSNTQSNIELDKNEEVPHVQALTDPESSVNQQIDEAGTSSNTQSNIEPDNEEVSHVQVLTDPESNVDQLVDEPGTSSSIRSNDLDEDDEVSDVQVLTASKPDDNQPVGNDRALLNIPSDAELVESEVLDVRVSAVSEPNVNDVEYLLSTPINVELHRHEKISNIQTSAVSESNVELDLGKKNFNGECTVDFESNASIKLYETEGVDVNIKKDDVKGTAAAESKVEFDENEKVSHVQVLTGCESNLNELVDEAVTSSNTQSNIELDKSKEVPHVQESTDSESNVNQQVDEDIKVSNVQVLTASKPDDNQPVDDAGALHNTQSNVELAEGEETLDVGVVAVSEPNVNHEVNDIEHLASTPINVEHNRHKKIPDIQTSADSESHVEFDLGEKMFDVEPTVGFETNVSIKLNENEGVDVSIEEDDVKCTATTESKVEFDKNEKVSHIKVLTNPESNVNQLVDEAVTSSNTQSNIELDKDEEVSHVQVLTVPELDVNQLIDEAGTSSNTQSSIEPDENEEVPDVQVLTAPKPDNNLPVGNSEALLDTQSNVERAETEEVLDVRVLADSEPNVNQEVNDGQYLVSTPMKVELYRHKKISDIQASAISESNVEFDLGEKISNVGFESNVSISLNKTEGVDVSIEKDDAKCTAAAESKVEFHKNEKVSHVQVLTDPESNVNQLVDEAGTSSDTQSNIEPDKNEALSHVQMLTDPESNVDQLVDETETSSNAQSNIELDKNEEVSYVQVLTDSESNVNQPVDEDGTSSNTQSNIELDKNEEVSPVQVLTDSVSNMNQQVDEAGMSSSTRSNNEHDEDEEVSDVQVLTASKPDDNPPVDDAGALHNTQSNVQLAEDEEALDVRVVAVSEPNVNQEVDDVEYSMTSHHEEEQEVFPHCSQQNTHRLRTRTYREIPEVKKSTRKKKRSVDSPSEVVLENDPKDRRRSQDESTTKRKLQDEPETRRRLKEEPEAKRKYEPEGRRKLREDPETKRKLRDDPELKSKLQDEPKAKQRLHEEPKTNRKQKDEPKSRRRLRHDSESPVTVEINKTAEPANPIVGKVQPIKLKISKNAGRRRLREDPETKRKLRDEPELKSKLQDEPKAKQRLHEEPKTHRKQKDEPKSRRRLRHDSESPVTVEINKTAEPTNISVGKVQPIKLKISKNANVTIECRPVYGPATIEKIGNAQKAEVNEKIVGILEDARKKDTSASNYMDQAGRAWSGPDLQRVERLLKDTNITITPVMSGRESSPQPSSLLKPILTAAKEKSSIQKIASESPPSTAATITPIPNKESVETDDSSSESRNFNVILKPLDLEDEIHHWKISKSGSEFDITTIPAASTITPIPSASTITPIPPASTTIKRVVDVKSEIRKKIASTGRRKLNLNETSLEVTCEVPLKTAKKMPNLLPIETPVQEKTTSASKAATGKSAEEAVPSNVQASVSPSVSAPVLACVPPSISVTVTTPAPTPVAEPVQPPASVLIAPSSSSPSATSMSVPEVAHLSPTETPSEESSVSAPLATPVSQSAEPPVSVPVIPPDSTSVEFTLPASVPIPLSPSAVDPASPPVSAPISPPASASVSPPASVPVSPSAPVLVSLPASAPVSSAVSAPLSPPASVPVSPHVSATVSLSDVLSTSVSAAVSPSGSHLVSTSPASVSAAVSTLASASNLTPVPSSVSTRVLSSVSSSTPEPALVGVSALAQVPITPVPPMVNTTFQEAMKLEAQPMNIPAVEPSQFPLVFPQMPVFPKKRGRPTKAMVAAREAYRQQQEELDRLRMQQIRAEKQARGEREITPPLTTQKQQLPDILESSTPTDPNKSRRGRKPKGERAEKKDSDDLSAADDRPMDPEREAEEMKRLEEERVRKEEERERKNELRRQKARERSNLVKAKRLHQKMKAKERHKMAKELRRLQMEEKRKLQEQLKRLPQSMSGFDEDTRMSAENSQAVNMSFGIGMIDEDSNGATNDASQKVKKSRMEVSDPDSQDLMVDQIAEYQWPIQGGELYMIQEQVSNFLGVKSFKRKYPDIKRRPVDSEERAYLVDSGLVSEALCDLGITAVCSAEVLDIMCSDFPEKYEEFRRYMRDKQMKELSFKQKAWANGLGYKLLMADGTKQDLKKRAMEAASNWNSALNKSRSEDRRCHMDLQTFIVHYPKTKGLKMSIPTPKIGSYPVSILPGQFCDYYKEYTSTELRYMPVNTVLYGPLKHPSAAQNGDGSQTDSDDTSSSDESSTTSEDTQATEDTIEDMEKDMSLDETTDKMLGSIDTSFLDDKDQIQRDMLNNRRESMANDGSMKGLCKICLGDQFRNKMNVPEVLITCSQCASTNHPTCLDLSLNVVPQLKTYNWQCPECKSCVHCKDNTDEDKMLFCDTCDRGYHIYCVGLKKVPTGNWQCQECTLVKSNICSNRIPKVEPGINEVAS